MHRRAPGLAPAKSARPASTEQWDSGHDAAEAIDYPSKLSVARMVNSLRGISSRLLLRDLVGHGGEFFSGAVVSSMPSMSFAAVLF